MAIFCDLAKSDHLAGSAMHFCHLVPVEPNVEREAEGVKFFPRAACNAKIFWRAVRHLAGA